MQAVCFLHMVLSRSPGMVTSPLKIHGRTWVRVPLKTNPVTNRCRTAQLREQYSN